MPGMNYLCYFACFVIVLALLVPFISAVTTSDLLYSTYFQPLSRVCYRDCSVSSIQCSCQVLDRVTGLDFPGEVILYRSQDWHSTSLRQLIEPLVKKSAECLKSCSLSMYYKKGCALHSCPWYECAQSCISDYKTSVNTVISQAVSSTQTSTRTNIIPPSPTKTPIKTPSFTYLTLTPLKTQLTPVPSLSRKITPTQKTNTQTIIGLDSSAVTDYFFKNTGEEWDGRKENCPVNRGDDWSGTGGFYLSHEGDQITFKVIIPNNDNYALWMRDNSDNLHSKGARNVIISIDGKVAGEVDAATANSEGGKPGYGWHKTITTGLTAGEHLITITKAATTSAAAFIDALQLSNNPDFIPVGAVNHSTKECQTKVPTLPSTVTPLISPTRTFYEITPFPSSSVTICPQCTRCTCASCRGYRNSANMNEGGDISPGSIGLAIEKNSMGIVQAIIPRIWLSENEYVIDSYIESDGIIFARPPRIITAPGTYKNMKLVVKTKNAVYSSGDTKEITIPYYQGCGPCPSCSCPFCPIESTPVQTYVPYFTPIPVTWHHSTQPFPEPWMVTTGKWF